MVFLLAVRQVCVIPEGAATSLALLGFVRLAAYLAQPHVRADGRACLNLECMPVKAALCMRTFALFWRFDYLLVGTASVRRHGGLSAATAGACWQAI